MTAILPFPSSLASSTYEIAKTSSSNSYLPALSDTIGAAEASAAGTANSLPTPLHFKVMDYIDHFQKDGRPTLQGWVNRSAQYYPMMKQIFKEYRVPEDLIYVSIIESGFNPQSVSHANAVGPWQFVPSTARQYGLRMDQWVDERRDPVKSTRAAAVHLQDLRAQFGSWPLALASYNAGSSKVQRAVLASQTRDFWNLHDTNSIPRETRNYVPKYMAVAIIASNLPAFGFIQPAVEPFVFEEVTIPRSMGLHRAAQFAGTTYQRIKLLNPELRQDTTPPGASPYVLRIPQGARQKFIESMNTSHEPRMRKKSAAMPEERANTRS